MTSRGKIILPGLLLFLFSPALPAQPAAFQDHPLLPRFPDSAIVDVEFAGEVNYRLILSSLQRIRGLVSAEVSERLRGNVSKILYEIPGEFSGQDVYGFYREQARERSYTELFSCVGRECGSSNYWANDIFRNRILYGPERNQFYMVMRAGPEAQSSPHIVLYIITRGNRRLYAYLEIIEAGDSLPRTDASAPLAWSAALREQGSIVVPGIEFEQDAALTAESGLSAVLALLEADPALNVYLVAHLYGDDGLDMLMQRSRQRADVLRRLLLDRGIDGSRIIARGVGPLAPACNAGICGDRVEIVLR